VCFDPWINLLFASKIDEGNATQRYLREGQRLRLVSHCQPEAAAALEVLGLCQAGLAQEAGLAGAV
jgi:hypothetical protein